MNRSHSRNSYPFDKKMPKKTRWNRGKLTTSQAKVLRDMHNSKQRQHNAKLCREELLDGHQSL